jgi:hypothetical protein
VFLNRVDPLAVWVIGNSDAANAGEPRRVGFVLIIGALLPLQIEIERGRRKSYTIGRGIPAAVEVEL